MTNTFSGSFATPHQRGKWLNLPATHSASAANLHHFGSHKTNQEKGNRLRPRNKGTGSSEHSNFKMKNCLEVSFFVSP